MSFHLQSLYKCNLSNKIVKKITNAANIITSWGKNRPY
jgi:hypothetical protein